MYIRRPAFFFSLCSPTDLSQFGEMITQVVSLSFFSVRVIQVSWLRSQFPSLDIEVDGGVGTDTIHKCAEVKSANLPQTAKVPAIQIRLGAPRSITKCLLLCVCFRQEPT